jgi:hypothetical protein
MLSTILLCGSHSLLEAQLEAQNLSRTLLVDGEQDRYLVPRHESRLESKWRTVNLLEEPNLVPDLVKAFRNGLERCTQQPPELSEFEEPILEYVGRYGLAFRDSFGGQIRASGVHCARPTRGTHGLTTQAFKLLMSIGIPLENTKRPEPSRLVSSDPMREAGGPSTEVVELVLGIVHAPPV